MIETGVDEFTVVLSLPPDALNLMEPSDWEPCALSFVRDFLERTGLVAVFGEMKREEKKLAGYTNVYTLGEHAFYLGIGYHASVPSMGVCVRFSATAYAYYIEQSGKHVFDLLHEAASSRLYAVRLSRIDLYSDYIDECVDVSEIYNGLMTHKTCIFQERGAVGGNVKPELRKVRHRITGNLSQDEVSTIYVGSRKENTRSLLRIYDKRREQIEQHGSREDFAKSCEEWVRFEASMRGKYAHALTEEILRNVHTVQDLSMLVQAVFRRRYQFWETDNGVKRQLTSWSSSLVSTAAPLNLSVGSCRDNGLARSLRYICLNSGLIPLLYKCNAIWGTGSDAKVAEMLLEILASHKPNVECRRWLRRHAKEYAGRYQAVEDFLAAYTWE